MEFISSLINVKFNVMPPQEGGYTSQTDDQASLETGVKGVLTHKGVAGREAHGMGDSSRSHILHCKGDITLDTGDRVHVTARKIAGTWKSCDELYEAQEVRDVSGWAEEIKAVLTRIT
jgi:hypothetical protein